jgi:hypothetical protein
MDLKSFFDLEKVIFSKEDLEIPYKSHAQKDIIFNKENLDDPYQSHPQKDVIFSNENLKSPQKEENA